MILLWLLVLPVTALAGSAETIRVALLRDVGSVTIDGQGVLLVNGDGKPLPPVFPLMVKAEKGTIVSAGRPQTKLVASAADFVVVNGKRYRGVVEFSPGEKGMLVVNELPLEDYLVGLINCEISSLWPMEAIKAQAVVARTYALYQKNARQGAGYHLESSVLDQVYQGCAIEDSRSARGVKETAGEVITFGGSVIQAFYHSLCGGRTESAAHVWGYAIPYLSGEECGFCLTSPSLKWEQKFSLEKIETLLNTAGHRISGLSAVKAGKRNDSGRVDDVTLIDKKGKKLIISAPAFRKAVGYGAIRSTRFTLETKGRELMFSGSGNGHGVGLCQWGARGQAMQGATYLEILQHYYPGTMVEKR